ncbi:Ig-like domain-containing protein [Nocardioides sp. SYSU D00038]|uniref:Ig-like domain-containing protein n=1 Tax=Nocardioides sp. SYSU D00038 TaxID=2812554 RepID=UPI001967C22C|nr:Ig-like domain-containing protein [Nocardioides sp. SYSU D00038]
MHTTTPRRVGRLAASAVVGALATAGLASVAPAAQAADEIVVWSHTIDLSETRATGHNDFSPNGGVRVWTEGSTSTDKAAGYFDVDQPLADVGEPSMSWVSTGPVAAGQLKPSVQLKTDFDGDGNIDGILVGEPTYANGAPLYGNDWWLSNGSEQFVKDAAPSHSGGSGSENHGTLAQWRTAFPDASVVQGGWSLGSGVKGDGTIEAIIIGGDPYIPFPSPEGSTVVKYESDVDLSETRAKGSNEFRALGGVRVTTQASDCQDPKPGGGTWCANKAAGYFAVDVPLAEAGEPSMDYVHYSGARPSVQLVTDFDGDGDADGILVGETIYGRDWWVPGSAQQFVKDGAPSHAGGSGSENHGLLSEWRAAFPDARVLQAGWSLGSGVEGDGVVRSITVGLTTFTFSGANRAPVAADVTGATVAGGTTAVTLSGTDADGDALTFATSEPGASVAGSTLTYQAPANFVGTKVIAYTVSDGTTTDGGTATVTVAKAASTTTLAIKPVTITTRTRNPRAQVGVTSTGAVAGATVVLRDGTKKVGQGVVGANGKVKITFAGFLKKGRHTFRARFQGSAYATASTATVVVRVKKA